MKTLIRKLKDEQAKIEGRSEMVIKILRSITYKQKPSHDDIVKLNQAIRILEDKKVKNGK